MPHDPATGIYWETHGAGPTVFVGLPLMASHVEVFGEAARPMLEAWLAALAPNHTVLLADYPGIGRSADHDPSTMTADRVVGDLLSVASAAGVERFAWTGYSWSAAVGLQLATRSDRVSALAIGGWPPLAAPYDGIRAASHARIGRVPNHARVMLRNDAQYRQWASFYASLIGWDEAAEVGALDIPALLYFGAQGNLVEEGFDVPIASRCREQRARLERLGWQVCEIAGFGHDVIGQTDLVLPPLAAFLEAHAR
jgi:pimeloyl-ACP methyl ester carboxylesterase